MFTPKKRSAIMGRIQSRGNRTTELRFVRILRKYRVKGWRRGSRLFGRPDFVFGRAKVAVFIDGDFWHGNPRKYRIPKSNQTYWKAKIRGNRKRDRLVTRTLEAQGWRVVRVWESDLRDDEAIVAKISLLL